MKNLFVAIVFLQSQIALAQKAPSPGTPAPALTSTQTKLDGNYTAKQLWELIEKNYAGKGATDYTEESVLPHVKSKKTAKIAMQLEKRSAVINIERKTYNVEVKDVSSHVITINGKSVNLSNADSPDKMFRKIQALFAANELSGLFILAAPTTAFAFEMNTILAILAIAAVGSFIWGAMVKCPDYDKEIQDMNTRNANGQGYCSNYESGFSDSIGFLGTGLWCNQQKSMVSQAPKCATTVTAPNTCVTPMELRNICGDLRCVDPGAPTPACDQPTPTVRNTERVLDEQRGPASDQGQRQSVPTNKSAPGTAK